MKTNVDPSPSAPVPSPTAPIPYPTAPVAPIPYPTAPVPNPTPPSPSKNEDLFPSANNSPHKKYVPPEERGRRRPFRKFVFICILCGIGYWLYKKRSDFNFARLNGMSRRVRNFYPPQFNSNNYATDYDGSGDSGMYESLTLTDMSRSSSFQPPTLPPGPSAYGPPNGTVA